MGMNYQSNRDIVAKIIELLRQITPGGGGDAIEDVTVNGTTVVEDGVAVIPIANTANKLGLLKVANGSAGLEVDNQGQIKVRPANTPDVQAGNNTFRPLVPSVEGAATYYGIARAMSYDATTITKPDPYPADLVDKLLEWWGIDDLIATHELTATATHAYAIGECFLFSGQLCKATSAIAIDDTIAIGTNCAVTNIMAEITAGG